MSIASRFRPFLAGMALCLAFAGPTLAAPKNAPTPIDPSAPSFVDLSRVLSEYRKTSAFSKYEQKLREKAKSFQEEMEVLTQLRYCTPAERQEALDLKAKPKLTDKEKARLEELMKKVDTLDNELSTLSQKANPTDADAKRIQELSKLRTDAIKNLAKEEADRRDQLRKLDNSALEEVQADMLKIVEKVAKDHKVAVVYNAPAVLFGGNDLTEDVLKKLPK